MIRKFYLKVSSPTITIIVSTVYQLMISVSTSIPNIFLKGDSHDDVISSPSIISSKYRDIGCSLKV